MSLFLASPPQRLPALLSTEEWAYTYGRDEQDSHCCYAVVLATNLMNDHRVSKCCLADAMMLLLQVHCECASAWRPAAMQPGG